jgi:chromosome segregation ATPase
MKTQLEQARSDLEKARGAHEAAERAYSEFVAPFQNKVDSLRRDISNEENMLSQLRKSLSGVLDNDKQVEEFEQQIEKSEKLLKRLKERCEIADQWHVREKVPLTKLQDQLQDTELKLPEAHAALVEALKENALLRRKDFIESCGELWAGMTAAVDHTRFIKPTPKELEVLFEDLVRDFGRIPGFRQ